jgi:hypothetical protein
LVKLTTLLRAVLADHPEEEAICAAIRECMGCTTHVDEGSQGDAIEKLRAALGPFPGRWDELHEALHTSKPEATIGDWVGEGVWCDWLRDSVKEMQALSNCGADCLSIILRTDWLIADMADVGEDMRELMVELAATQCRVYVHG